MFDRLVRFSDDDQIRLRKAITGSGVLLLFAPNALFWSSVFYTFDADDAALSYLIPAACAVGICVAELLRRDSRFIFATHCAATLTIIAAAGPCILLGGITQSGQILIWSLAMPLCASCTMPLRFAFQYFAATVSTFVVCAIVEATTDIPAPLPKHVQLLYSLYNMTGVSCLVMASLAYFVYMRDRAERRLSDALKEADIANRAKTRFLASASHDLRQPMQSLSLFSGALLMQPLDTRSLTIASQIDKAVNVLAAQLDSLLDISKLDAGVVLPDVSNINISVLLQHIADDFSPHAHEKRLVINCDVQSDLWGATDPLLFRRIVENLLSNAVKYSVHGAIEISARTLEDRIRIGVSDTGLGIPRDQQILVFEEFYQVNNPGRDRAHGLGLGLAIVRRLSDLLGLQLHFSSEVGVGTRFMIDIPAGSGALVEPASQPNVPSALVGQRILIIDDEEDVRMGMRLLLEEMGFNVAEATSTSTALELCVTFLPALVLADYRLRGADTGIAAIQSLRARVPDARHLLVSGDTAPERLREARLSGIDVIHKPVSAAALRSAIVRVMASS